MMVDLRISLPHTGCRALRQTNPATRRRPSRRGRCWSCSPAFRPWPATTIPANCACGATSPSSGMSSPSATDRREPPLMSPGSQRSAPPSLGETGHHPRRPRISLPRSVGLPTPETFGRSRISVTSCSAHHRLPTRSPKLLPMLLRAISPFRQRHLNIRFEGNPPTLRVSPRMTGAVEISDLRFRSRLDAGRGSGPCQRRRRRKRKPCHGLGAGCRNRGNRGPDPLGRTR